MILHAAKDRLGHRRDVKLLVTAQPTVVLHAAPTYPGRQEFRADFITMRIIENTQEISRLGCEFESWRVDSIS